jgi:hypothetical protein
MMSWWHGSGGSSESLMAVIWERKQLPYGLPPRWTAGWAASWAVCLEHRSVQAVGHWAIQVADWTIHEIDRKA